MTESHKAAAAECFFLNSLIVELIRHSKAEQFSKDLRTGCTIGVLKGHGFSRAAMAA